jgi:hypothetical protein
MRTASTWFKPKLECLEERDSPSGVGALDIPTAPASHQPVAVAGSAILLPTRADQQSVGGARKVEVPSAIPLDASVHQQSAILLPTRADQRPVGGARKVEVPSAILLDASAHQQSAILLDASAHQQSDAVFMALGDGNQGPGDYAYFQAIRAPAG